jgi:hypothetical protein
MTDGRIYQLPVEVALQPEPDGRTYQLPVEVALQPEPDALIYQHVVEVATQNRSAPLGEAGNTGAAAATLVISGIIQGVATGDSIVVQFSHYTAPSTLAITDNLGNTYTEEAAASQSGPAFSIRYFRSVVTNPGTLTTITASMTPDQNYVTMAAALFVNLPTDSATDQGDNTGNGTVMTFADGIAIPAGAVVIGMAATNNPRTFAAGSDSGSPSVAINLVQIAYEDPAAGIAYAEASVAVSAFTGTMDNGLTSNWVGTAMLYAPATAGGGGEPIDVVLLGGL